MSETIAGYEVHPAASVFPLMEGEAFRDLVADVRKNGLLQRITVMGRKVLDGRNRLRACVEAGVEPQFTHYEGDDPIGHVVSLNMARRHMSESQRSMVAGKLANLSHGGDRSKPSTDGLRQEDAAKLLNVSVPSVERARKVINKAVPEAVSAVEAGQLSVSAGSALADLSPETQREVLAKAGDDKRAVIGLVREAKDAGPQKAPRPSADPVVAARDEEIIATYRGKGGESVGETANILGLARGVVQDAVFRAGLSRAQKAARDPLRGFIENASASEFGWKMSLDSAAWSSASDEQVAEALSALDAAIAAGRKLASKVRRVRSREGATA